MPNYKIVILTTFGCEGCNIAIENVRKAIKQCSKPITLEIKTREDVGRKYLKYHDITDFPAILFCVNDRIKYKVYGSKHPNMIIRWIDLYFCNL